MWSYWVLGAGYLAAVGAMLVTIFMMIVLDVVYPPAVSTTLSFAFRAGRESGLTLFILALLIIAVLVVMQRVTLWVLARWR